MSEQQIAGKTGRLKKISVRIAIATGAALLLGWAGYTWYLVTTNEAIIGRLDNATKELAAARSEVTKSGEKLRTVDAELTAERGKVAGMAADKNLCEDKVAAFAKQAASCDGLKKKLHVKE